MKNIAFVLVIFLSTPLIASKIIISSLGFSAVDNTNIIQQAFTEGTDTIVFDNQNAIWYTQPLLFFTITNKVVIFEPGLELKAKANAFNATYAVLLSFKNAENLKIIGYSAILSMQKSEYVALNDSEYRHGLSFWNCRNIEVKGLTIKNTGGDGIYIGGENDGGNLGYCENVLIEDVRCINNYRQGLSICSVQNMTVRFSEFSETIGTAPEAGIDVEPYETYMRIVNLFIYSCAFKRNNWTGLALALVYMDSSSLPVSITVSDCLFERNGFTNTSIYQECEIMSNANNTIPVQGSVVFNRCQITESDWSAYYSRNTHDAFSVTFNNCAFLNVSGKPNTIEPYNDPIFLEVPDYANPSDYVGNLAFNDCLLTYSTNFSYLRIYGAPTLLGAKNITGNLTIFSPNTPTLTYFSVADTINAIPTFVHYTSPIQADVSVIALDPIADECGNNIGILEYSRIGSNINYPLPVQYSTSSNTILGDDIHLLTSGVVFPTGVDIFYDTIVARKDVIIENTEDLNISISTSNNYTIIPTFAPALINLYNCFSSDLESSLTNSSTFYPNPTEGSVSFNGNKQGKIEIIDLQGKILRTYEFTESIDLSMFSNGIYYLKTEKNIQKIILKK